MHITSVKLVLANIDRNYTYQDLMRSMMSGCFNYPSQLQSLGQEMAAFDPGYAQ